MQCPRCGYPIDGTAKTCVRCGLVLSTSGSIPSQRPFQNMPGFETSQTIDGVWREDDGGPGGAGQITNGDGPPSWLLRALRASGLSDQPQKSDISGSLTSEHHAMQSGFATPPAFRRDVTPASGAPTPAPTPNSWQSLPPNSADGSPFSGYPEARYSPLSPNGPGLPVANRALAPLAAAGTSGQLVSGSSLKGGRYRVIQSFYGGSIQPPRNEPPLMIASDSELPSGRVLVQELLLSAVRPADSENARRLIAERLLALRSHPGMPRLIDQFGQQGRHFLIFELPSGDLLADRLQRAHGPLPEDVVLRLAVQLTEVLQHFEQQSPQFIHGNLSPASIILRPSGQVVVVGCSPHLLLYPDGAVDYPPAGGIAGYAAPEQLRGQATTRSDIFSVCAVIYHAITGVAPAARANAPYPPARRQNPEVSLELEEILGQGLRPSWTQRYQTAGALRNALERLASGKATHVPDDLRERVDATRLVAVRDAKGRLQLPRRRRLQNPLFLLGIILSLIVLVGVGVLIAVSPHRTATTGAATPNSITQMVQQQNIGLSDGEFFFDTARPDSSFKTEGARYLASGNLAGAHTSYLQAVGADPSDAEAAIYAEDLQISLAHSPFVTIAVGTAFDPNADPADVAAARSELEGIYLAQHRINSGQALPHGLKLQVMVLNSGLSANGAVSAAHVLVQQIANGNTQHIVGVVGWPEVAQTELARSELKSSGLFVVSPTGSDQNMTSGDASLFRLVSLDSVQAAAMADVAVQDMGATNIAVVFDPKNTLSNSMADSFVSELSSAPYALSVKAHSIAYTSDSGADLAAVAQEAVVHDQANLIFLSAAAQGADVDSLNLVRAVVAASQSIGEKAPPVLVDSRAYTPGLLGIGTSSAATLAANIASPAVYSDLYVETPANLQEWTDLMLPSTAADQFLHLFTTQYYTTLSPDQLPGPNATVLLSYDSVNMLAAASISAITNAQVATEYPTITDIREALMSFSTVHPFIGMSGAISFDQAGDLNGDMPSTDIGPRRAFGILQFVPFAYPLTYNGQLASPTIKWVAGDASAFCGGPETCVPSTV